MVKPQAAHHYIEKKEGFVWPYNVNERLIDDILTLREWKRALREFVRFVDGGGELCVRGGNLLLKTHGVYAFTDSTDENDETSKIKHREQLPYEVVSSDYWATPGELERLQGILPVTSAHKTAEEVGYALRKRYQLGYETRVLDVWNNRRTEAKKDGFPSLW
ncbi:MAG: hypothetical protein WC613_04915 [Candidatus Aenigmatarchaeota archaeon]